MANSQSYTNSINEIKTNLQLNETDPDCVLISDDAIFEIIDSVVPGEFSRVNPRILSHSYIGNSQFKRELPFYWIDEISGAGGIRINGNFVDRSTYKIVECDETERSIADAIPAAETVTLTNSLHSNFFRAGDPIQIGFDSNQAFIGCAYVGFAIVGGINDLANSIVTGYDYINGSILKLNQGNVVGEINWITAIDSSTGVLTLLNPINQEWAGSGVIKKINHLIFSRNTCYPLSIGNNITVQYCTEQVFSETAISFSGGNHRAFIYLATSEVARAIASGFSRFQISTFSSDTVDRADIVALWEARADDYLKKFRDYYGVDEQLQNDLPGMVGIGNDHLERAMGYNGVYNSNSSIFYHNDDNSFH